MNILFFAPYNQSTPYIESIIEELQSQNHSTYFLSFDNKGQIHKNIETWGTKTFSLKRTISFSGLSHAEKILRLILFCNKHKIGIVYSHYQESNIISVFAQYFLEAKFILTRHHTDCAFIDNNWKEKWGDKIINLLAKIYIAPSKKVYSQLVEIEKTNPSKVKLINYGYNFNALPLPNNLTISSLKTEYKADLLLVSAARFIPEKRHSLLINEFNTLIKQGYNLKLLLLGKGPLINEIDKLIKTLGLETKVYNIGFKTNPMDYYAAADMFVHFSLSEASNSAVKEVSMTNTPVMVCENVGDFDDYIIDQKNGFLLDQNNPGKKFSRVIKEAIKGKYDFNNIGNQLHQEVVSRFDVKNVISTYLEFSNSH